MSNISQQVLLQAFNQGLGTHTQLPGYTTPTSMLNSYVPQVARPMTFASFTPGQIRMMQLTGGTLNNKSRDIYSSDNGNVLGPRTAPKSGFGVL